MLKNYMMQYIIILFLILILKNKNKKLNKNMKKIKVTRNERPVEAFSTMGK